ncbi:hypothetical protein [Terribacillus saccharophilus]|uniref:hypothetical protein n=1 Tax=Terribacillus saccharophilus TaxID=361277 RepID=UPI003D2BDCFC
MVEKNKKDKSRIGLNGKQKKYLLIGVLCLALIAATMFIISITTISEDKEIMKLAKDQVYDAAIDNLELEANKLEFNQRSDTGIVFEEVNKATVSGWVKGHNNKNDENMTYTYNVYLKKAASGKWGSL